MKKDEIKAKKVIIETEEEILLYEGKYLGRVFKKRPDSRGRIHLGTSKKVIIIELNEDKVNGNC